jgi:GcrA cell cycle regulator
MSSLWTNENIVNLHRFAEEGKTGKEIAELLGLSRSAVLGKCHREGIHLISGNPGGRNKNGTFARTAPEHHNHNGELINQSLLATTTERLSRPKSVQYRTNGANSATRFKESNPSPVAPKMRRLTLMELSESTCRWPIGEPKSKGFRYCGAYGADNTQGRPYCPYHSWTAYETPQQRAAVRQAWAVRSGRSAVSL